MSVFPFMQKIEGKRFLVIGSGALARRKVRLLLQFTDRITLITHTLAREADQKLRQELSSFERMGVEVLRRPFTREDVLKADYCIASSDTRSENHRISTLCHEADIPVNVPDNPADCSFFMPSVIKKGRLVITVSTGGSSPAMSAELRRRIEDMLPSASEEILDRMEELRAWAPAVLPCSEERGKLYADILTDLMEGSLVPSADAVRTAADEWLAQKNDGEPSPDLS